MICNRPPGEQHGTGFCKDGAYEGNLLVLKLRLAIRKFLNGGKLK